MLADMLRLAAGLGIRQLCCTIEDGRATCRGLNSLHTYMIELRMDVENLTNAKTFIINTRASAKCRDNVPTVLGSGRVVLCGTAIGEVARCEQPGTISLEPAVVVRIPAEELRRVAVRGSMVARALVAGAVGGRPALGLDDVEGMACSRYTWDAAEPQAAELAAYGGDLLRSYPVEAFELPARLRGLAAEVGVTREGPARIAVVADSISLVLWVAPYREKPLEPRLVESCVDVASAIVVQDVGYAEPKSTTVFITTNALVGQPLSTFHNVFEVVPTEYVAAMPLPWEAPSAGMVVPQLEGRPAKAGILPGRGRGGFPAAFLGEHVHDYIPAPASMATMALLARAAARVAKESLGATLDLYHYCRGAKRRVEIEASGEIVADGRVVGRVAEKLPSEIVLPASMCRRGAKIIHDDKMVVAIAEQRDRVLVALPANIVYIGRMPDEVKALHDLIDEAVKAYDVGDVAALRALAKRAARLPLPSSPLLAAMLADARDTVANMVNATADILEESIAPGAQIDRIDRAVERLREAARSGSIEAMEEAIREARRELRAAEERLASLHGPARAALRRAIERLAREIENVERQYTKARSERRRAEEKKLHSIEAEVEKITMQSEAASNAAELAALASKLLEAEQRLKELASSPIPGVAQAAARAMSQATKAWLRLLARAREIAREAAGEEELQQLRKVLGMYREAGHGGPPAEKLEKQLEERRRELQEAKRRKMEELTEDRIVDIVARSEALQRWLLRQKYVAILTASGIPTDCYMDRFSALMDKTRGQPLERRQAAVEKLAAEIVNEPKRLWAHFANILSRQGLSPEDYKELFDEVVKNTWCQPFENRLYEVEELALRILEHPMPSQPPTAAPKVAVLGKPSAIATSPKKEREKKEIETMLAAEIGTDDTGKPACKPIGYAASLIRELAGDTLSELFFINPQTRIVYGYSDDILGIAAGIIDRYGGGAASPAQRKMIETFVKYMRIHVECEMKIASPTLRQRYEEAFRGQHYWNIVLKKYALKW